MTDWSADKLLLQMAWQCIWTDGESCIICRYQYCPHVHTSNWWVIPCETAIYIHILVIPQLSWYIYDILWYKILWYIKNSDIKMLWNYLVRINNHLIYCIWEKFQENFCSFMVLLLLQEVLPWISKVVKVA